MSEGDVEISAIPEDQLQALVAAMADGLFAAFDALEEENYAEGPVAASVAAPVSAPVSASVAASRGGAPANPTAELAADEGAEETTLWRGRPYLTIGLHYELTSQRLRIFRGILGQRLEEIELVRVRDTKVKQHAGERALNVGDITIFSTDPTTPEIELSNVRNPMEVRELIRSATLEEKNRRGLYYREEM
ncbi:MAG: PH domain-containing protein [Caldilineaceae bacterium]|nr:PH domain-containing protein [Caldilineaceae bacterium]